MIRLTSMILLLTAAAFSAIPLKGGEKILFVGNSLTNNGGGLDNFVREACAAGNITVTTSKYIEFATELIDIYNHGNAVNEIKKGWDIVVLQGWLHAEDWPAGSRAKFIEAVKKFHAVIKPTGARTVLYMTFPGQFQGAGYASVANTISASYDSASKQIENAPVAPCGRAWLSIWSSPPPGKPKNLLYADDIHENENGHLLNSYVFYQTLTGKSPIGLKVVHPGYSIDAKTDSVFQYRAWLVTTDWMTKHGTVTVKKAEMKLVYRILNETHHFRDPVMVNGASVNAPRLHTTQKYISIGRGMNTILIVK